MTIRNAPLFDQAANAPRSGSEALPVTLCGDDDRGITERVVTLPESTPAWPGDCPWCPERPDDTCTTLGAIARGDVECHHRTRDGRLLPCLWLTAEQSPTGEAMWWDGYVEHPDGEWRVHRPSEMDPIEAAALRAAAIRSAMRGER